MRSEDKAVVIVVCGAAGSGKTSLITAATNETFPQSVAPTLPPTRFLASSLADDVEALFVDTSSREEDKGLLMEEWRNASVVMMTYSVTDPSSLYYLQSHLLPSLRALNLGLPVVLVGCKLDLRGDRSPSLEPDIHALINDFREIETCLECSAKKLLQVNDAVYLALKAVLHPTGPLFDTTSQQLKPRCVRALRRIFHLCDQDKDGVLNDRELNEFQVLCFGAPLQAEEIAGVKKVVHDKLPSGITEKGLSLTGFLFLHALFIERGRMETTWTVLRKFGYNDALRLREELVSLPFAVSPDMSVELAPAAVEFLHRTFHEFDRDKDGALSGAELEELFSTAPSNPWADGQWGEVARHGSLTLSAFMAQWELMTLLAPQASYGYLLYLGYQGEAAAALVLVRRRWYRRKHRLARSTVFKCLVLGPPNCGKSAILDRFIGRPFEEKTATEKDSDHLVAAAVDLQGQRMTLVLHEPCASAAFHLSPSDVAQADVAALVFDSSCAESFQCMLQQLHGLVELGQQVSVGQLPVVVVAAKDDLRLAAGLTEELALLCGSFNLPPALSVSMKDGDTANLYRRLVTVASNPEGNVPLTASMKAAAKYQSLVHNTLTVVVATTAIGVVAMAAWRLYSARRAAS